jgi:hypothetical protein
LAKKQNIFYTSVSILLGLLGLFLLSSKSKKKKQSAPANDDFLSPIDDAGRGDQKELWLALMKVESANFESKLYKETFNCTGMNCVKVRPTTQIGCTEAIYDGGMSKGIYFSRKSCVDDLMMWARYTNFPKGPMDVRSFTGSLDIRGYFGVDPMKYMEALKSWL